MEPSYKRQGADWENHNKIKIWIITFPDLTGEIGTRIRASTLLLKRDISLGVMTNNDQWGCKMIIVTIKNYCIVIYSRVVFRGP